MIPHAQCTSPKRIMWGSSCPEQSSIHICADHRTYRTLASHPLRKHTSQYHMPVTPVFCILQSPLTYSWQSGLHQRLQSPHAYKRQPGAVGYEGATSSATLPLLCGPVTNNSIGQMWFLGACSGCTQMQTISGPSPSVLRWDGISIRSRASRLALCIRRGRLAMRVSQSLMFSS